MLCKEGGGLLSLVWVYLGPLLEALLKKNDVKLYRSFIPITEEHHLVDL